MKKLMSLAVCLAISVTAFPADRTSANAPDAASIKAEIARRGTGEKARVRVTTRDNRQMSGYIKEAGDSSFVLPWVLLGHIGRNGDLINNQFELACIQPVPPALKRNPSVLTLTTLKRRPRLKSGASTIKRATA